MIRRYLEPLERVELVKELNWAEEGNDVETSFVASMLAQQRTSRMYLC